MNKPRNVAVVQWSSVIFNVSRGFKATVQLSWTGFSCILSYLNNKTTSHLCVFMFASTDGLLRVKNIPPSPNSQKSLFFQADKRAFPLLPSPHPEICSTCYLYSYRFGLCNAVRQKSNW